MECLLYVVKILAAGGQRAYDYVLSIYTSIAISKFLKSSA
jgi:hypothetical protein